MHTVICLLPAVKETVAQLHAQSLGNQLIIPTVHSQSANAVPATADFSQSQEGCCPTFTPVGLNHRTSIEPNLHSF